MPNQPQKSQSLSAAGPVEWQRKTGDFGWQRVNAEDLPHYREKGAELRALYTAPSVAVKALRWKGPDSYGEYHSLDGLWGYIIRAGNGNGFWLTEIGDYFPSPEAAQAAAKADYEARIRSALSAQVQDVVGWQPIETAPKDGTMVDLWCRRYTGKPLRITDMWWTDSTGWRNGVRDKFVESIAKEATHWRHVPGAPAKQEG